MNVDLDTNLEEVLPSNISPFFFHYPNIFGFVQNSSLVGGWTTHLKNMLVKLSFPKDWADTLKKHETTTQSSYKLIRQGPTSHSSTFFYQQYQNLRHHKPSQTSQKAKIHPPRPLPPPPKKKTPKWPVGRNSWVAKVGPITSSQKPMWLPHAEDLQPPLIVEDFSGQRFTGNPRSLRLVGIFSDLFLVSESNLQHFGRNWLKQQESMEGILNGFKWLQDFYKSYQYYPMLLLVRILGSLLDQLKPCEWCRMLIQLMEGMLHCYTSWYGEYHNIPCFIGFHR